MRCRNILAAHSGHLSGTEPRMARTDRPRQGILPSRALAKCSDGAFSQSQIHLQHSNSLSIAATASCSVYLSVAGIFVVTRPTCLRISLCRLPDGISFLVCVLCGGAFAALVLNLRGAVEIEIDSYDYGITCASLRLYLVHLGEGTSPLPLSPSTNFIFLYSTRYA